MIAKEQPHLIGSFDVETDELSVQKFAEALNCGAEPLDKYLVPRVFPFKWLSEPPIAAQLLKYRSGVLVQPSASIAYERQLVLGMRYKMAVEVTSRTEPAAVTLVKAAVDDVTGGRVLTIATEVLPLHREPPTTIAGGRSPAPVADGLLAVDVPAFTAGDVHRYIDVARDPNELHTNPMLARSFGFGGCVVPGLLILGRCEMEIAKWRPESSITAMFVKFLRPVIVGEPISLHGRITARSDTPIADFVFRLVVRRASADIVCVIDAHVAAP
jgi:acyl dehydratase